MKKKSNTVLLKKLLALSLFIQMSVLSLSPIVTAEQLIKEKTELSQELDLLRGEHYLFVNATENASSFHIRYSFPPDYNYQVPIFLEIVNDSTANILNYEIQNDTFPPNKIINFTFGPMQKGSIVSLHFYCWVLINNTNYSHLPRYVKIPKRCELPTETRYWLSSSEVVQSDNILIKMKAFEVKGFTHNILRLAQKIAFYVKWHRLPFYSLQLTLGTLKGQDALTTLFRNGDCPGRSHLASAFFRANGVPAQVVLVTRNYPFWYQMHFMIEYYCPNYGWILSEVHNAETPYEPKNQIIMRICSLEDENSTGHDFIFSKMTGVEQWFWIDNNAVKPYYKDLKEGSKVNMFPENEVFTISTIAFSAMNITQFVFSFYQQYLGKNFSAENLIHFQNALGYQKQAIISFKQSDDPSGYLSYMNLALTEYTEITN